MERFPRKSQGIMGVPAIIVFSHRQTQVDSPPRKDSILNRNPRSGNNAYFYEAET
jgi:hypothetical protein